MPICIAGMHRSGTSMIARVLNLAGLYLGKEEDLVPAQPDNPEGFWEHSRFHEINERILHAFGGGWDFPPHLPPGWQDTQAVEPIRSDALDLLSEFEGREPWGWKDPRNSLTLALWKSLIPGLKVLVPLRNPLDVADSLSRRGYASSQFGLNLWADYAEALAAQLPEGRVLFTHYSSYFQDPAAELARVAPFCGLIPSEEQIERACASISARLRHSDSTMLDLLASHAGAKVLRHYFFGCLEAGPVYAAVLREEAHRAGGASLQREMRKKDKELGEALKRKDQDWRDALEAVRAEAKQQELRASAMQAHLDQARLQSQELQSSNDTLTAQLASAQGKIHEITSTGAWAVASRLASMRQRLIPNGSFGHKTIWLLVRGLRLLKNEGPGAFARRAISRLRRRAPVTAPKLPPVRMPAQPPSKQPHEELLERLGVSSDPLAGDRVFGAIRRAMSFDRYALSIAHDSYLGFTGGIQALILDEMAALKERGFSHINLCPLERVNEMRDPHDDVPLLLSVDGTAIGVARCQATCDALLSLSANDASCDILQLHHALNWNMSGLEKLLHVARDARRFFWIHDYFSVCPNYNLLRNDRAFCNAPPLESNSCMICRYGEARTSYFPSFARLFEKWDFTFVAPSEVASHVWRRGFPQHADKMRVVPIYSLKPSSRCNLRSDPGRRKIKIAFPGLSYHFKGWSRWRRIADALSASPAYELYHLGQKTDAELGLKFPERFEHIKSNPANRHLLPQALERHEIDIVFYCPLWPETFSLIAYEAHGAGAWTVTMKDSGNVARYVGDAGSGKVFERLDDLAAYLENVEAVREDLRKHQGATPLLCDLTFNDDLLMQTYLGDLAARPAGAASTAIVSS